MKRTVLSLKKSCACNTVGLLAAQTVATIATTNRFKTACISTSATSFLAPADKPNGFSFRSLQISNEGVLVLCQISVRTRNLPVHETFFNFANEKSQFVLLQRA